MKSERLKPSVPPLCLDLNIAFIQTIGSASRNFFSLKIRRFCYFTHNVYFRIAKLFRYFLCRSKQYTSFTELHARKYTEQNIYLALHT